uniref:Uncharacterized protein n=1 Tax=Anser cygnoides TaxID=8845 RepID=A0A8B9ILX3_ANSCY
MPHFPLFSAKKMNLGAGKAIAVLTSGGDAQGGFWGGPRGLVGGRRVYFSRSSGATCRERSAITISSDFQSWFGVNRSNLR